jgi:hypothetical protein
MGEGMLCLPQPLTPDGEEGENEGPVIYEIAV